MQTESEKLRDAARAKNQAQVEAIAKDFGRNACGTCHTPFRVPPPASGLVTSRTLTAEGVLRGALRGTPRIALTIRNRPRMLFGP